MDILEYAVDAYNFVMTLVGVILDAFFGPLGFLAGTAVLVLAVGVLYLLLNRRRSRRLP